MQERPIAIRVLVAAAALAVSVAALAGQEPSGRREIAVTEARMSELRRTDELIDALARNDELVRVSRTPDRNLPERAHEGLMQYHEGVPVHGGGISRQLAGGVTVSIFGTFHEGIDVDTTPLVPADDAEALIARQAGAGPATGEPPSLVILPTLLDTCVLAWRMPMDDGRTYFLDAHLGSIVHEESNVFQQHASVGVGAGIRGQRKKLSTSEGGGRYRAYDLLRPAAIATLDMRHDLERTNFLLWDPEGVWSPSDVASDADNLWDDSAVVDVHAHEGLTYDYLALRHGWHGMDGENGRIISVVNIGLDFDSAFFAAPPYGPEGTGVIAFGHERDGTPIASADVVGHEIMHGVTFFSVSARTGQGLGGFGGVPGPSEFTLPGGFTARCGESYTYPEGWPTPDLTGLPFGFACTADGRLWLMAFHGGAVNEAYSDMFGTAVEFMLHEPAQGPLTADYLMYEDSTSPFRSLADPGSIRLDDRYDHRFPDAYSGMILFLIEIAEDRGREIVNFSRIGSVDGARTLTWLPRWGYGGNHWNSTILSHAFYLAIEGGRHRTTGVTVQGVGGARRREVESAFFRAMTDLMPSSVTMDTAASAILQSAADLFGPGSSTHRAIGQAMAAVGLLAPAAN